MLSRMETESLPLSPASYGVEGYVHKHRREHEAAFWDEGRVQVQASPDARLITNRLLIRFASCGLGLSAVLWIVVAAVR
jgi:hypothetical protein